MRTATKPKTVRPLERDVQKSIVDALRLAGLTVRETSAWKQKGPSGVDKGIPDLLVFVPELPYMYIGLEVKRDCMAKFSPEQTDAAARREYEVAWTPGQALEHVLIFLRNTVYRLDSDGVIARRAKIASVLEGLR